MIGSMSDNAGKVKSAPNSKESEMMVLGCMLSTTQGLNASADGLDEADFYYTEHRAIFSVLQGFWRTDKPADVHLVCEELKRQGKLKAVGGAAYVTTLAQYAGTSAYVEEYVNIVSSKAVLRRMIDAAQVVEKRALDEPPNVHEALDEAQQLFFRISQAANPLAGKLLRDILAGAHIDPAEPFLQALEARQEHYIEKGPEAGGITGVRTHYADLDRIIDGMGKSNLLILAGRPAMGKTALAVNIAENVCFRSQKPVGLFSLEMTAEQLVHRIVSSQAQVEAEKIRNGSLNGMEYQRIVAAVSEMQKGTMVIDDQPGLRINDLRARARRMKEAYGVELLVIDYLQLLSGSVSHRNNESRQNEVSEISRHLKNLARELNIPILCCSQLSRKVEERTNKRPVLSDLRESGSLEQDADVVMMILRRDYYDPLDKPGMAEIIVAKNRHGAVGNVQMTYRKEIVRFENYSPVAANFDPSPDKIQV